MLISVAIVEDDPAFRATFTALVTTAADMRVHSVADDLDSGLALLGQAPADVLLVDLGLPGGSGLQIITHAKKVWPDCDSLVISVFGDMGSVLSAIQAGATGYLIKDSKTSELAAQIRTVHNGGSVIESKIARRMLKILADAPNRDSSAGVDEPPGLTQATLPQATLAHNLTPQERQVLMLANKGYQYDEVARLMGVSRHTVQTYVKRCYRKLHVNSKAGAIYEAQRLGIELD